MSNIKLESEEITISVMQHEHPLLLVDLQPNYPHYEEDYEEEDAEEDRLLIKWDFRCTCNQCGKEINFYHRYYFKCSNSCEYFLHKSCEELPKVIKHKTYYKNLTYNLLIQPDISFSCYVCQQFHEHEKVCYEHPPNFFIDVKCAMSERLNRIIYHPCHSHPLECVNSKPSLCWCDACGKQHMGIFYHCTTCFEYTIHVDCAFLPKYLLIQDTQPHFRHTHPLILSYSFPLEDQLDKFYPRCRICGDYFSDEDLWMYKCENCRYYAHLDCATAREEPFMSAISSSGIVKVVKNYKDEDHPNLLRLPFPDETCSILKHLFSREIGSITLENTEEKLSRIIHPHPLILVTQSNKLHNPMKSIELLCNGCVRPVMSTPFYKCSSEDHYCNFVLHEWCTHLPAELPNHPGHPQHTLIFLPKVTTNSSGVFICGLCYLYCNGFAFGCVECHYYVDVNCGFIPENITHEAHPNHILSLRSPKFRRNFCVADHERVYGFAFTCNTCDFNIHPKCGLMLHRTIRHRFDKHPMTLRYAPIEDHKSEYFCEICENELDPNCWFYHCDVCKQSIHTRCAPLILINESASNWGSIYKFLNIKFGGIHKIEKHEHSLSFAQGIRNEGECVKCGYNMWGRMILKCMSCNFAIHYECVRYL